MQKNSERMFPGKKAFFQWTAVFLLILFLLIFRCMCGDDRYQICGQFSFGGGAYRQTTMNVIVNWNASAEKVADEIVDEYLRVNADNRADKIILRLYHSRRALKKGKYFREYVLAL